MLPKKSSVIILILFFTSCGAKKYDIQPGQIITPEEGNIIIKVLATGSITPYHRIELKVSDKGRIEKLFFDEGNLVKENDILALVSTMDRITLIDSARANLIKAQKTGNHDLIETSMQELKTAENAYNPIPIISPVTGEIIKQDIVLAQYVTPDTPLIVISDRLILNLQVNEADIGKIFYKQKLTFYLDTFPDENYSARIEKISREAVNVANVMKYTVLAFPDKVLRKWIAGMTVNAEFVISEKKNILMLPLDAIKKVNNKNYVALINEQKEKSVREVTTGIDDYKNIEILSGIDKNDKILLLTQNEFMAIMKPRQGMFTGRRGGF